MYTCTYPEKTRIASCVDLRATAVAAKVGEEFFYFFEKRTSEKETDSS